jgi:cysteine sulfinate desulfinase/cysteine desulfurase-like protein
VTQPIAAGSSQAASKVTTDPNARSFGLGRFNTEEEVDYVIDEVTRQVKRLRSLDSLAELASAGR